MQKAINIHETNKFDPDIDFVMGEKISEDGLPHFDTKIVTEEQKAIIDKTNEFLQYFDNYCNSAVSTLLKNDETLIVPLKEWKSIFLSAI